MLEPVLESLLLWLVLIDTQVISLLFLFPFGIQFSTIRVWMLSLENLSHFMFSLLFLVHLNLLSLCCMHQYYLALFNLFGKNN